LALLQVRPLIPENRYIWREGHEQIAAERERRLAAPPGRDQAIERRSRTLSARVGDLFCHPPS
jgi:hypothetical protein